MADERRLAPTVQGARVAWTVVVGVTYPGSEENNMARLLVLLLLAWATTVGGVAHAKDVVAKVDEPAPPEAVARFLMGTRLGYITCSGKYRSYLEKMDLYTLVNDGKASSRMEQPSNEDSAACVHSTVLKGKSLYNDAAKHAAAPAGRTALKEYMTAWEASLGGLQPAQPEKLRDFDTRNKKQEARLDELQKRVESQAR